MKLMLVRVFFWLLGLCAAFSSISSAWADAPRVAVWNPQQGTTSSRFKIDLEWLNEVTRWLDEAGVQTTRLTTEAIDDEALFSAQKFDAAFFPGDAFPRRNTKSLQRFADEGGVLVALGAGPVPFLNAINAAPDGTWGPSPTAPNFAWETSDIYGKSLGLVYDDVAARRSEGIQHEATALFKKYLPVEATLPPIAQRLPSRWLLPRMGADIYPLIRSKRADGLDTVPQLFMVKNEKRYGIVAISDTFTKASNPPAWALTKPTIVALAKIATDLKSGVLILTPEDKITLRDDEPAPD